MPGSKITSISMDDLRAACLSAKSLTDIDRVRAAAPYVWDGKDPDDRPLTEEEMLLGIEVARRRRNQRAKLK